MEYVDNTIPGYFFIGDYYSLEEIVKQLPNSGTLVEIGTFLGRTAMFWAELLRKHNKKYRIICLDLFENKGEEVWKNSMISIFAGDIKTVLDLVKNKKDNYTLVKELLAKYPEIELHKFDLYKNTPNELDIKNVTCVFEDAEHTRSGVRQCLNNWYPLLEPNGIYCGHDFSPNFREVILEVNTFANENNLEIVTPRQDSTVYYYKKI